MGTRRRIILFLYVLVICVFAGSTVADTVIPYELNNGWTYEAEDWDSVELIPNPSGGIIVNINIPPEGGLEASRHDLTDYSLHDNGFIQLEYSSLSSEITGTPEGPSLCLEIEFYDADSVFHEMAIAVSQDAGGYSFETWFQAREGISYYDETPVPDGLSLAEGALGLYSDGSLVLPYFMDAAGSVLYPFDAWDVSGITGTHEYRVDNDFEGSTMAGGTIIASVNLEQVVYGPGPSCPTLFYWDGSDFVEKGFVLGGAIPRENEYVDSVLLKGDELIPYVNGRYYLQIRETEPEISFIDAVQISVIAPLNPSLESAFEASETCPANAGHGASVVQQPSALVQQPWALQVLHPLSAVHSKIGNVLPLLSSPDAKYVRSRRGDYITLSFSSPAAELSLWCDFIVDIKGFYVVDTSPPGP